MDVRDRLIEAALAVYAETGYRGATTRRIAHEAGVNEITLFRHFGSKDALMQEALSCARCVTPPSLPDEPTDPQAELMEWTRTRYAHLHASRSLIRKVLGELEEHPEVSRFAKSGPHATACDLHRYVERLRARGLAAADVDVAAAATMLMGVLFTDAMSRDVMPEVYHPRVDDALASYVRLFLRAIGAPAEAAAEHQRALERPA